MLYHLLVPLSEEYQILNVFRYITFRSGGAILTALLISFIFGNSIIEWLRSWQKQGQPIRKDGPKTHQKKAGTPTMGGLLILFAIFISVLLWANLENSFIWIMLFVTGSFGLIGFIDDYLKVTKRNTQGFAGKVKIILQTIIALTACVWINSLMPSGYVDKVALPFLKDVLIDLGGFYLVFVFLVIVGASNAVNLTDGLDGLAIGPIMIASCCFGLIAYLVGNAVFADYLQIHPVSGAGEITIFCASIVGAGLGFLWYNAPPAKVFMGDVGSLSLGAAIGTASIITKHEIVLAMIGGLFVIEALSVILQVGSYKLRGKRVFLMAPIHHHFEKKGWSESTVVIRFWIIAIIFALIGLATLKLR